jgi:hypothetical protein
MLDYASDELRSPATRPLCPRIRLLVATVLYALSLMTAVYWTGNLSPASPITTVRGYEMAVGDIRHWPDQIRWGRFKFQKLLFSAPTVNALFIAAALLDLAAMLIPSRAPWAASAARWSAVVAFGYAVAAALLLFFGIVLGAGVASQSSYTRIGLGMPLWLLAYFVQLFCRRARRGEEMTPSFRPPATTSPAR